MKDRLQVARQKTADSVATAVSYLPNILRGTFVGEGMYGVAATKIPVNLPLAILFAAGGIALLTFLEKTSEAHQNIKTNMRRQNQQNQPVS